MPKHQPLVDIESMQLLQNIWLHLAHEEFALFPSEDIWNAFQDQGTSYQRWFTTFAPYTGYQLLDQIIDAVHIIQLHLKLVPQSSLTWNYLGNQSSQDAFMAYITKQFWKYQNEVMQIPGNGPDTLNSIWRTSQHLAHIVTDFLPPTDFMDEPTQQRLQRLTDTFAQWEYDPYLLVAPQGSLHWSLSHPKIEITGFVYRSDEGLSQTITYSCLTTDQFESTMHS